MEDWLDPTLLTVTGVIYLIVVIMLWKMILPAETNILPMKIGVTVLAAPIIYFIAQHQLNK